MVCWAYCSASRRIWQVSTCQGVHILQRQVGLERQRHPYADKPPQLPHPLVDVLGRDEQPGGRRVLAL